MSRREFRLKPSARLQRYLGRELIADPNLAVIEFVKNAYDAGASDVTVRFSLTEPESSLLIMDNGSGMTMDSFESDWMHPGFSRKSEEAPASVRTRLPSTIVGKRQQARIPLGEKGIGRFAAGRLGDILEVFTRVSSDDSWLHVTFEWDRFKDMTKSMDEIAIPYDSHSPPEDIDLASGTVILIRQLRLKWDSRVPGRPAVGRRRTRLGRLMQDLELLLRPLHNEITDFRIELDSDSVVEADDIGVVTPRSAHRSADYRYEFTLYVEDDHTVVERRLERSTEIVREFGGSRKTDLGTDVIAGEEAKRAERSPELSCGGFGGTFYYDPPPRAKRAALLDAIGHGVLLYRDGALVEPYGLDGNDWVGVGARKAQRQGHALIQPNTFSGEIHIGRVSNPWLQDMANRQGLIDNEAVRQFIAHVQAEFRQFEATITPELVKRWKSKPERAAESAEQRLALAIARMRSVAHSLRQPLLGLSVEVAILKSLLSEEGVPLPLHNQIAQVIASVSRYIGRSESLLNRLGSTSIPEFTETPVRRLLENAVLEVANDARQLGVHIEVECHTNRSLIIPLELMVDAIGELLRNAIEAPRQRPIGSVCVIATDHRRRDVRVEIRDDGPGLEGVSVNTPLTDISLETKGRPSGGLAAVADSVLLVRGKVALVANSRQGATFEVLLPGGMDGLETVR